MSGRLDQLNTFAMKPTKMTLFMRTFPLWQFIRFIRINLKMIEMIRKSHG